MAQNIYSESTPNLQKKGRKTGANLREQVRDPEEQEGKKEKDWMCGACLKCSSCGVANIKTYSKVNQFTIV